MVEADLLALSDGELQRQVRGCDAVISCLGHTLSLKGVFGRPRDLVERATAKLCRAIAGLRPPAPIKLVLMSSVSVNRPDGLDRRRGPLERAFVWALRGVLPPARDNQRAADLLLATGPGGAFLEWVVVRPDTLLDGGVTPYAAHEELVNSLSSPGSTNMANVADFMCELVTSAKAWAEWKGKLPVLVNAASKGS